MLLSHRSSSGTEFCHGSINTVNGAQQFLILVGSMFSKAAYDCDRRAADCDKSIARTVGQIVSRYRTRH
jgi:hypothetical protein